MSPEAGKSHGAWRALRYRLEAAAYRGVTGYLGSRQPAQVRRFGYRLGRLGRCLRSRRRLVIHNLGLAFPDLETAAKEDLADRCFRNLGGYFCELTAAWRWNIDDLISRFEVEGWQHLDEVEARGKGYIIFSGHLGFWELGTYPLARRVGDLHMVARMPSNPLVAAEVAAFRHKVGHRIVERRQGAIRMRGVLRDGGRLVVTADQYIRASSGGVPIPFLGHPASVSTAPAFLSRRMGLAALPIYCFPEGDDGYRLVIEPPIEPDAAGDDVALTRLYLASIEKQVHRHPEQWLWPQRLWREVPGS